VARNFCLLAFIFSLSSASENFWFSYKITTQNQIMTSEERNISPSMVYKKNEKREFLCKIKAVKTTEETPQDFLNAHYEKLLECFYVSNSRVNSYSDFELKGMLEQSELTILPIKFTVDFKDEFANIYLLR
jgi:predicted transglutaminase-like cysteine proteinase